MSPNLCFILLENHSAALRIIVFQDEFGLQNEYYEWLLLPPSKTIGVKRISWREIFLSAFVILLYAFPLCTMNMGT